MSVCDVPPSQCTHMHTNCAVREAATTSLNSQFTCLIYQIPSHPTPPHPQDGAKRVFELFAPSMLGPAYASPDAIDSLVQSLFPDAMLLRKVTLEDIERTIAFTEGFSNQE